MLGPVLYPLSHTGQSRGLIFRSPLGVSIISALEHLENSQHLVGTILLPPTPQLGRIALSSGFQMVLPQYLGVAFREQRDSKLPGL